MKNNPEAGKIYRVDVVDSSTHWASNGRRFETRESASDYAADLAMRWTALRDWRVVLESHPEGEKYIATS